MNLMGKMNVKTWGALVAGLVVGPGIAYLVKSALKDENREQAKKDLLREQMKVKARQEAFNRNA
jgi:uncharacterized membrane-anchored protein YhcB (DUF1043 family)